LNPNTSPSNLQIGQIILVPVQVLQSVVTPKMDYGYSTMMNQLKVLKNIYPFINIRSIGRSVLGKSIPEIQIGNGPKRFI
jgi:g-D-glutamyl-meso-diaminopimelate peptidase